MKHYLTVLHQYLLVFMVLTPLVLLLLSLSLLQAQAYYPVHAEPTPQPAPQTDLALLILYPGDAKKREVVIVNRSPFHTYGFSFVNHVAGDQTAPTELLLNPGQMVRVDVEPPSCAALQLRTSTAVFYIGPLGHVILHLVGFDCYPQTS